MEKLKMPCRYDTYKDLHDRLHNTICRYNDEPVLVIIDQKSNGHAKILLYDPPNGNTVKEGINFDDPLFDISSPELGYVNEMKNGKQTVYYFIRTTAKKYKQGLMSNAMMFKGIDGKQAQLYASDACRTVGFCNMLRQKYPSVSDVIHDLRSEKIKEAAVSQDIALQYTDSGVILVYLRMKNIGFITPGREKVILKNNEVRWIAQKALIRVGMSTMGEF